MQQLSSTALSTVHGGFNGNDGWTDAMSNGCGGGTLHFPNGTWRQACVDHDHRYFLGGTQAQRLAADHQLRADMIAQGASRLRAQAYYEAVRHGAASHWGSFR